MRLYVVSCGKRKIWDDDPKTGATEAQDAYTGSLFRTNRAYAEKFSGGSWLILSSKYGFLEPRDTLAGNYNVTFGDPEAISPEKLVLQADVKGLFDYDEIIVLGSRRYTDIIKTVFAKTAIAIRRPVENARSMGSWMSALRGAVAEGSPLEGLDIDAILSPGGL